MKLRARANRLPPTVAATLPKTLRQRDAQSATIAMRQLQVEETK
jgi:hypothetical protein